MMIIFRVYRNQIPNEFGAIMMKRLIVISDTKDPYVNHAIEEILFSSFLDYEQILFLWVNNPAVVFGRNQNPWREVDVKFAQSNDIKLLRRISGGGTVYHDTGNLNYSFIEKHNLYDESSHFEWIKEAIGRFGLELVVSPRKDLTVEGKKVSGSAFYMKGMRRLHHGTLLIDADLDVLWQSLKVKDEAYKNRFSQTRSIVSVPSPVVNLKALAHELRVSDVMNAIVDVFYMANSYEVDTLSVSEVLKAHQPTYQKIKEKHTSWDWVFGETPNFTYEDEMGNFYEISGGKVKPEGDINSIF
jgi:lipoate-protein ligase A